MRLQIALLSALALTGCATADKITLPGGEQGYAVTSAKASRVYNKAAEICAPGTYEIADKSSQTEGGFANGVGAFGGVTTIIIRCKAK